MGQILPYEGILEATLGYKPPESLIKDIREAFGCIFSEIENLQFYDTPNYDELKGFI